MTKDPWRIRWTRFMNRHHARRAARARPATAFVSSPEPRTVGSVARGRQLIQGNLLFAGYLVEAPGAMVWDLDAPNEDFEAELHGFAWLDDLAAVGDAAARNVAQMWLWGWIERYGRGTGAGWTPALTGRRLIRWMHHAIFLLRGQDQAAGDAYFRALGQQTLFLSRRWHAAPQGLPRFEAICALIYAGIGLKGMETHVDGALAALEKECGALIDASGAIPSRNPEELLEVLTLLLWVALSLEEGARPDSAPVRSAIQRIVPVLRALRHADGSLARFHGGGRGLDGRLDLALATAGLKRRPLTGEAMGYRRLSAGRTSLVVDAAAPPSGAASVEAHAATLAFELTSGRRPLIVSCGSGALFGHDWRRAGRATPSHSTLILDGTSSARLGDPLPGPTGPREPFSSAPNCVTSDLIEGEDGQTLELSHDGYAPEYGLTHGRSLELSADGRSLSGEDVLAALDDTGKRSFDRQMDRTMLQGLPYVLRFHLHPDVDAELDMNGGAISLKLRSGEVWVFRHDGTARLGLEASVFLERGRLRPRATRQIVLASRAMQYVSRVRWTLAKAQDTALAIRDFAMDEADPTH